MSSMTPCALCGGTAYRVLHDMGWRRVLCCTHCRLVRADPVSTLEEKVRIETDGYLEEKTFPEVRDFFANCHRDYVVDPVIRTMGRHIAALERELGGPGTLLDVGAGTGIFMHLARERGWRPEGIDICAMAAEKAAHEFDLPITIGAFERHAFDGRQFDAASMLDVLEHVPNPLESLRRLHAVVRPGGAVMIAVPNQRCLLTRIVDLYAQAGGPLASRLLQRLYVPPHLHYFSPSTLRAIVSAAGFQVRSLRQGSVYLGRYRMSLATRIPLEVVLAAGACVGMNARLAVLAVK
jgi:2-polyprenyl-3-methyl-5-hydroxy-6-metoxy-1,4-benzoquinol methylase